MMLEEVAPPVEMAVSLAVAKDTLRIDKDDTSFDALLPIWIAGITSEAEHQTGQVFVNRPMRLTLDRFPDSIRLSAPTFSVESLQFLDPYDEWQTLDPADYYVDRVTKPGYIVPARGRAWPATAPSFHAVVVDYTAGWGIDTTAVPQAVRMYVLAKLQVQFNIEIGANAVVSKPFNVQYLDRLLDPLRMWL